MDAPHLVVIVGAGFSGLGMAVALKRAGLHDFVVVEKAPSLGGTWRDNSYPGCACDVPSNLYSYSFAPNPGWSQSFAPQPEILAYLERVADQEGLRPHLRLGQAFQGAAWDERAALWRVSTDRGELRGRALVLGLGPLHHPRLPDWPGLAGFPGPVFHTARWDHGVELAGKRVAVVGTGGSAIQVVPALAPRVSRLVLFQRTPAWVIPRHDRAVPAWRKRLYQALPIVQQAHRAGIYGRMETAVLGMVLEPRLMDLFATVARRHLRAQVADPALRQALTPDYSIGCKRILLSDDFYPALCQPHVALVRSAVERVEGGTLVAAGGSRHEVDAVVLATGFHVTDALARVSLTGRQGLPLATAWAQGPAAYLGATVHGFPNLYFLLGPNTGLGHSSMVYMIESQVAHVMAAVRALASGARAVEVRADAQERFVRRVQQALRDTVWGSGCRSWYVDADGQNRTLWPGFTWQFRRACQGLDVGDYDITPAGPENAGSATG